MECLIYSGFIPKKSFIYSVLIDLLSVLVSTEDITVNRPGTAPGLVEIAVSWRTQTSEKKGTYATA